MPRVEVATPHDATGKHATPTSYRTGCTVKEHQALILRPGGASISYRLWQASSPAPRLLLIVHGGGEHGGRYRHVAEAAVRRGWTVLAPDLRGHGLSSGVRGHVDRFDDYLDDLDAVLIQVRDRLRITGPLAVLGHSLGGLVAAFYLATHPAVTDAAVLTSPLIELVLPVPKWKAALGPMMSRVWPSLTLDNGIRDSACTSDPSQLDRGRRDPLLHSRASARFFTEMNRAIRDAMTLASQITVPLLVLQAGDDQIASPAAAERFYGATASADKHFRLCSGLRHEVLNEPQRDAVIQELLDWLDARVPVPCAQ